MLQLLCIAIAVLGDFIVAYGDWHAKKWVLGLGLGHLAIAAACYLGVTSFWFVVLKLNGDLGKTTVLWASGGLVMALMIGRFGFGEVMTVRQWVGATLSVAGVILVSF